MKLTRRLLLFAVIALLFEGLALIVCLRRTVSWLLYVVIGLVALYLLAIAVRGWRKQARLNLPPSMPGHVLRRRHWKMF
ncbi:MAG: hypothetical protein IRZ33_05900 [Alicyclobacillaceae bacterium]|nr:hypothetical protein [Alicyclobacillaceae bacterium]